MNILKVIFIYLLKYIYLISILMETIMIRGQKTSVEKENIDECYLNPKDNIINEHYNQLLFKSLPVNLLFYLPLNEILVLILEEKLIIYDIKMSIVESLKIIDEVFYKDIINKFSDIKINKNENERIDKNKKTTYFMGLNFITKEHEDKQIKNILVSDDFYNKKGLFIIIIEFMNLDIYIIEYNLLNEINNNPKITLILKTDKYMFIDKKSNLNNINKLNENYYKNSYKTKFKIIKYLNYKIYLLYQHQYNFYIYNFIVNEISLFANINKNQNRNKNNEYFLTYDKICLKEDITQFDSNYCYYDLNYLDYFEFITVTIDNKVYYNLFTLENNNNIKNNKNFKLIINEKININNEANISNIKYYKINNDKINDLFSEKIFFVIQLNHIFIIKYFIGKTNKGNFIFNINYKYLLKIIELNEEKIYNIFFLQKKYLYIFTRKNKYIEYNLDLKKMKNNNNTETITIDEKPKFFKVTKFIYDMKPFQSENGFFILITQNPIRPINMNIIYKINYNQLIPIENNFSEGLILGLRYIKQKIEFINKDNNYIYNKRYNYFINKIFKGQKPIVSEKSDKNKMKIEDDFDDKYEEDEENENINEEDDDDINGKNDDLMNINSEKYQNMEKNSIKENNLIKNDLIDYYINKVSKILYEQEYLNYLNNDKFKCEFCGEKFINFDKNEKIYKCSNNDITFSCCITKKPINNNFLWCSYCTLFYSQELKLFYCIVCDKILTKLDSF